MGPLAAILVAVLRHLAAILALGKAMLGRNWAFLMGLGVLVGGLGVLLGGSWVSLGDLEGPLRSLVNHVAHFVCYLDGFGEAF